MSSRGWEEEEEEEEEEAPLLGSGTGSAQGPRTGTGDVPPHLHPLLDFSAALRHSFVHSHTQKSII